jgi:hypothetical protein
MRSRTAYPIDQYCVNLIHEYFKELIPATTTENIYHEPAKQKTPTDRNNDRRYDDNRDRKRLKQYKKSNM